MTYSEKLRAALLSVFLEDKKTFIFRLGALIYKSHADVKKLEIDDPGKLAQVWRDLGRDLEPITDADYLHFAKLSGFVLRFYVEIDGARYFDNLPAILKEQIDAKKPKTEDVVFNTCGNFDDVRGYVEGKKPLSFAFLSEIFKNLGIESSVTFVASNPPKDGKETLPRDKKRSSKSR